MMHDGLRIRRVYIRAFGGIREFEGTFSDRVFIDNSYEHSTKIDDLVLVIKNFLGMGLNLDDSDNDIIGEFRDKIQNKTYIEIGFVYDKHDFLYRFISNDDGTSTEYIRDNGSKFTIHGKLLFEFMTYIMNPYYMRLSHFNVDVVNSLMIDFSLDSDIDLIWYAIKHYEPIDGVNEILDFTHEEYDDIAKRAMRKYGYGVTLIDKFSVRLIDDGLACYMNGDKVDDIEECDTRYQIAFALMRRIVANYLVGQLMSIEDGNLVYPPMVLDARLEDNNVLDFGEVLSIVKSDILDMPRQVFFVDGEYLMKLIDEDLSLDNNTRIYDSDLGLNCITKTVY